MQKIFVLAKKLSVVTVAEPKLIDGYQLMTTFGFFTDETSANKMAHQYSTMTEKLEVVPLHKASGF